jgi:integrase
MAARKLKKRKDRWYADFREFEAYGGGREALKLQGDRYGVTDKRAAQRLYDQRLAELLQRRSQDEVKAEHHAISLHVPDLRRLEGVLQHHIEVYRSYVDPSVTQDRQRYKDVILSILPPSTPIRDLNRHTIKVFLLALKDTARQKNGQPFSGQTRVHIFRFLRASLDGAVDAELIQANPANGIPAVLRPRPDNKHANFYTPEEMGRILEALRRGPDGHAPDDWPPNTPIYLYEQVALGAYTGARRNEVQAQRWEWVDWDQNLIQVHTSKVRRGESRNAPSGALLRAVPLWPQLRTILRAWWAAQGEPSNGLMFPRLRPATRTRKHPLPSVERGGISDKSIHTILRLRGLITGGENKGEALLFEGSPGYVVGFQEFRVTYCATRLQTVEKVSGVDGAWAPVARRTVEAEMGHQSSQMVDRIYGRVSKGKALRLDAVEYPHAIPAVDYHSLAGCGSACGNHAQLPAEQWPEGSYVVGR